MKPVEVGKGVKRHFEEVHGVRPGKLGIKFHPQIDEVRGTPA